MKKNVGLPQGLFWVQTVFKCYQQTALAGKELTSLSNFCSLLLNFYVIFVHPPLIRSRVVRESWYSKTCVKRPLNNRPNKALNDKLKLNEGQKYCRAFCHTLDLHPAIFGLKNQFVVVLRVAVLHRFYCSSKAWIVRDVWVVSEFM